MMSRYGFDVFVMEITPASPTARPPPPHRLAESGMKKGALPAPPSPALAAAPRQDRQDEKLVMGKGLIEMISWMKGLGDV
jgi:hypothetical protein